MNYPKYYKSAAHNVKLISERQSLWVSKQDIQELRHSVINFIEVRKYLESTESEFKKAFNKTSKYLKSLI